MVGSCHGGCSVPLHVVGFAEYFRSVLVRAFLLWALPWLPSLPRVRASARQPALVICTWFKAFAS
jgi:hypothetical protein